MTDTITIKATTIKGTRSRGRPATSTRTVMRGVRADAHPAEIMYVMSLLFPLLLEIPAWFHVRGVRYELLRIESRTVNGARVKRAVFKDEQAVRKSFAREMRRRHRAARKAALRAIRAEARAREARASEMIARTLALTLISRAQIGALLAAVCTARYRRLAARVQSAAISPLPSAHRQKELAALATSPRPLASLPSG